MTHRTALFATLVAALALVAGPATAQDPDRVLLAYKDPAVDRPIALALAEMNEMHGTITDAKHIESITTGSLAEHQNVCVVVVGKDGIALADSLRAQGVDAREAQGRDRYETAWLAAMRVGECR